ncbi:hypothetical protein BKA93DRAFT_615691 [Sparassis latifolia]
MESITLERDVVQHQLSRAEIDAPRPHSRHQHYFQSFPLFAKHGLTGLHTPRDLAVGQATIGSWRLHRRKSWWRKLLPRVVTFARCKYVRDAVPHGESWASGRLASVAIKSHCKLQNFESLVASSLLADCYEVDAPSIRQLTGTMPFRSPGNALMPAFQTIPVGKLLLAISILLPANCRIPSRTNLHD